MNALRLVDFHNHFVGSDLRLSSLPARLHAMFEAFGLDPAAREAIAGGNALRLLRAAA